MEEWQALAADTSGLFKKAKGLLEPVSLWMLKSGVKSSVVGFSNSR